MCTQKQGLPCVHICNSSKHAFCVHICVSPICVHICVMCDVCTFPSCVHKRSFVHTNEACQASRASRASGAVELGFSFRWIGALRFSAPRDLAFLSAASCTDRGARCVLVPGESVAE